MTKQMAARVHVILSRDGKTGIAVRRGPTKQVCTVGWDRQTDEFTLGQWLKGRIYERRCDLSPDGKYFIYFAMNGRWSTDVMGSWSAISRAPYLKAISLWPKGDCWNGGGLFTSETRYWLNDAYGRCNPGLSHGKPLLSPELAEDTSFVPDRSIGNNECLGVYHPRLLRDGWKHVDTQKYGEMTIWVFDKQLDAHWTLRKLSKATTEHPVGKGCYFDQHELRGRDGTVVETRWDWAELDNDRLVFVEKGALKTAPLSESGLGDERILHDFNDYAFRRIKAPY